MHNGFLNINKPAGFTSHDVVSKVRRIFSTKSVGHMGTLDPEATGVLPLALGRATRLIPYVEGTTKEYVGELVLGVKTDTLDLHGKEIEISDIAHITVDDIKASLQNFIGLQQQIPPMYSAIKIGGKKLYEYARAGIDVTRQARQVEVYYLELLGLKKSEGRLTASLRIGCSKGTYIRSLCRDIGAFLGVAACMGHLTRTASGPFYLTNSVQLGELNCNASVHIIPVGDMFPENSRVLLQQDEALRFLKGQRIVAPIHGEEVLAVFYGSVFLGIGNIEDNILSPKKVLAQEGDIL